MKKLIIYAPSVADFAMRYVQAARDAGFEPLLVLCKNSGIDIPASVGVEVWIIDGLTREPAHQVATWRSDSSIAGIVPGGEFAVEAAEYVARELGLIRGLLGDPAVLRNKHLMRLAFAQAGVSQPRLFGVAKSREEAEVVAGKVKTYPVVSKPLDAAGSWHVFRSSTRDELLSHMSPVFEYTSSKLTGLVLAGACLVEEYVEGDEFSAEVIVQAGRLLDFFVTRKYVSQPPHFDEVGHLCGVSIGKDATAALSENLERIVAAARVQNSVLHVEFKLTPHGRVVIIEVAGRIAGDHIAALVEMQFGCSLESAMVLLRTGQVLKLSKRQTDVNYGVRFLFRDGGYFSLDYEEILSRHRYDERPLREEFSSTHLTNRVGHEFLIHRSRQSH